MGAAGNGVDALKVFVFPGLPAVEVADEDVLVDPRSAIGAVAGAVGLARAPAPARHPSGFRIQRGEPSRVWRERFLAEGGDPNHVDPFVDP